MKRNAFADHTFNQQLFKRNFYGISCKNTIKGFEGVCCLKWFESLKWFVSSKILQNYKPANFFKPQTFKHLFKLSNAKRQTLTQKQKSPYWS
jgi:hypothetical protein